MSFKELKATKEAQLPLTLGKKIRQELFSWGLILLLLFTFRSVFYDQYRIPTGSMIPTLMIGDSILVNKFSYGFKVPFSSFSIKTLGIDFDPIYLFGKKDPERGDVVVFKFPRDPSSNYIKRVVGIPGDTLEIRNNIVYINNTSLETKKISGEDIMADMDDNYKNHNFSFYRAKTGRHDHIIQFDDDNIFKSDFRKLTIPQGKFFVMGDNRDFSSDSRSWGFVSHKHIRGKALLVWFSMIVPFFSQNKFKFRYWRIGKRIL